MAMKIMVVDAEPRSSALMRSVATALGYSVQPFSDYGAAAEKSESQVYDAIFVGIGNSDSKALELVRRIRASERNRSSVVVLLSSTGEVVDLRQAIGEGADLFLVKPVQADRLHRMLVAFPEWKDKRHAVRLPLFVDVECTWNGQQSHLKGLNISESGMLVQPSPDAEIGEEVALAFKITDIQASLAVVARIARKEGKERAGLSFVGLAPEDVNAIHVYITGRMKDLTRPASAFLSETGLRRLINP